MSQDNDRSDRLKHAKEQCKKQTDKKSKWASIYAL
jgi:hypothetical protein